jgi:hypothetical protein
MEILEDERSLMLKLDTIYQNVLRYPDHEAFELLNARRQVVRRDLAVVRNELRKYIENLFEEGDSDE